MRCGPGSRAARSTGPAALITHRPLLPHGADETDEPRRYVEPGTHARLTEMIESTNIELVVSGHVHQWRVVRLPECTHVWAPSTWATLPDGIGPRIGTKVTGMVELQLEHAAPPVARLVRPAGLSNLTIPT